MASLYRNKFTVLDNHETHIITIHGLLQHDVFMDCQTKVRIEIEESLFNDNKDCYRDKIKKKRRGFWKRWTKCDDQREDKN